MARPFEQFQIDPKPVATTPLTPTPGGAVLETGELISPNFVPGRAGWSLGADGDLETVGPLRSGQTGFNAGTGFWIGNDGNVPKLSIGDPNSNNLTWDGDNLAINGFSQSGVGAFGGDGSDGVFSASSGTDTDIITYDGTSNSGEGASVNTRSWSHTCGSSENRLLVVLVATRDNTLADRTISSVTYNGDALTLARADDNSDIRHSEIWYRIAPATGSNTVLVTAGGTCDAISAVAMSFSGVAQSSPIDVSGGVSKGGGATSTSVPLTTTVDNAVIIDVLHNSQHANSWVKGDAQTSRYSLDGTSQDVQVSTRPAPTAGTYTNTWNWTTRAWRATTAIAIKPGTLTSQYTMDLGGESVVTRNYKSITIDGTGQMNFSNPHDNGTVIILKSQGDVTITSSTNPAIDLRLMGAKGGIADTDGNEPTGLLLNTNSPKGAKGGPAGGGGGGGSRYDSPGFYTTTDTDLHRRAIFLACGAGGGGGETGGGTAGVGGRGAGALLIECGGALTITGTINSSGEAGTAATGDAGAAGGGSGAKPVILYNTLILDTGTYTSTGGAGGGSPASGGADEHGGGGAGSIEAAGGAGGATDLDGNAGGVGAGGGGAGSQSGSPARGGGAGGASMGGLVARNTAFA